MIVKLEISKFSRVGK